MRPHRLALVALAALPLAACGGSPFPAQTSTAAAPATTAAPATSSGADETSATADTPAPTSTDGTTSTPAGTSAPAGSCAALAAGLTPEQRVGQLLMVGLDGSWEATHNDAAVTQHHVGNHIYLGGWQGADRVRSTSAHLQSLATQETTGGIGMLVAADQEGGVVQQLKGAGFTRLPKASVQAAMAPAALTGLAKTFGSELKAAGVNIDLAPVADTVPKSIGTANEPIGKWGREYGSDPAVVERAVTSVTQGLTAAGIGAAVKHFPGLGRITGNTDFVADGPKVTDAQTTADDPYLRPFAAGAKAGAAVMVSSARYPRLDPANQAVFSKAIITDLLRTKMGFTGLVMTDDMGSAKAVAGVTPGQRAVRFLDAGGDMIITGQPRDVAPMTQALLDRRAQDPAFATTVDAAVARVLAYKARLGLASCS